MLATFWGVTLYGGSILRYGGPLIFVTFLILGMYSRRYSPLSSTSKTGDKLGHKRQPSDTAPKHKSLDEIVDTLQEMTGRCNTLLEPFLIMTDFLSTQRTPTSATTRPALTTLFIRILLVTPAWILLTLPPFYILTARRIVLLAGTITLSWHSTPAKITRVILWRSVFLRRLAGIITGLNFPTPGVSLGTALSRRKSQANLAADVATKSRTPGVRFTFILFENQRRWIGLGWTTSLFATERGPWTDEHLNPAPSKDEFELPDVDGGVARWRWLKGSDWQIEHGDAKQHKRSGSKTGPAGTTSPTSPSLDKFGEPDGGGWIYYDNKWNDGRREDGWGRYTRRRKWFRDAELVEITPSTEHSPAATMPQSEDEAEKVRKARAYAHSLKTGSDTNVGHSSGVDLSDSTATIRPPQTPIRPPHSRSTSFNTASTSPKDDEHGGKDKKKKGWFGKNRDRSDSKSSSSKNTALTNTSNQSRDGPQDDVYDRWRDAGNGAQGRMSIGEDLVYGLS